MVNNDPYFELPPGYTKVRAERIREVNGLDPAVFPRESQQISAGILDDQFKKIFNMKLIEPQIINEKYWVVKPDIYVKNRNRMASPTPKRVGLFNSNARGKVRRSI